MDTPSQESVTRLARQIFERVMASTRDGCAPAIEHGDGQVVVMARRSLNAARIFEMEAAAALAAAAPAEAARRQQRQDARAKERQEQKRKPGGL